MTPATTRRGLIGGGASLLALAACGRPEPVPPAPALSFRDRAVPIASTTRGGPSDLAGEWVVSEAFPGGPLAAPGTRVSVAAEGGGAAWAFDGALPLATALVGPGRHEGGGRRLWVLWVDDGFRTAAVGTPDGSLGWVMDRPGEASPDRSEAARRMLGFNGYDVERLVTA